MQQQLLNIPFEVIDKLDTWASKLHNSLLSNSIKLNKIIKIILFIPKDLRYTSLQTEEMLKNTLVYLFKETHPLYQIIHTPNQTHKGTCVRVLYSDNEEDSNVKHQTFQNHHYCIVEEMDNTIVFSGLISQISHKDYLFNLQKTFDFAEQLLDKKEFNFAHIIHLYHHYSSTSSKIPANTRAKDLISQIKEYYFDPELFTAIKKPSESHLTTDNEYYGMEFIATQSPQSISETTKELLKQLNAIPKL